MEFLELREPGSLRCSVPCPGVERNGVGRQPSLPMCLEGEWGAGGA